MPDLLIRHVDDLLVEALRDRAAAHGRSAEAEHRAILAQALGQPARRSGVLDGPALASDRRAGSGDRGRPVAFTGGRFFD